jgi:hypothetical protein
MTDSTENLVAQRGAVHGDFTDVSLYGRQLKGIAQGSKNWTKLTSTQKEGLDMILHKVARILAGDPNHHDHWDDIAGYATITSKRIPKSSPPEKPAAEQGSR